MQASSDSESRPEKIVCRLNGKYKEDLLLSLETMDSESGDARVAKLIQSVTSELGLHIGLGMAKCEGSGCCRHRCDSENQRKCDDPSESEMTMGPDAQFSAEIQNLVDLDGRVICEKLEFVDGEEPEDFEEKMRKGEPSDECIGWDVRDFNLIPALLYLLNVWIVY